MIKLSLHMDGRSRTTCIANRNDMDVPRFPSDILADLHRCLPDLFYTARGDLDRDAAELGESQEERVAHIKVRWQDMVKGAYPPPLHRDFTHIPDFILANSCKLLDWLQDRLHPGNYHAFLKVAASEFGSSDVDVLRIGAYLEDPPKLLDFLRDNMVEEDFIALLSHADAMYGRSPHNKAIPGYLLEYPWKLAQYLYKHMVKPDFERFCMLIVGLHKY